MAIDACYMPLYSMMNDVEFVLEKMEEKNEEENLVNVLCGMIKLP